MAESRIVLARGTGALFLSYFYPIGWGLFLLAVAGVAIRAAFFELGLIIFVLLPAMLLWMTSPFIKQAFAGLIGNLRHGGNLLSLEAGVLHCVRPGNGSVLCIPLIELSSVRYDVSLGKPDGCSFRKFGEYYSVGFESKEIDADVVDLAKEIAAKTALIPAPKQIYGFGRQQAIIYEWTTKEHIGEIEAEQSRRQVGQQHKKTRRLERMGSRDGKQELS